MTMLRLLPVDCKNNGFRPDVNIQTLATCYSLIIVRENVLFTLMATHKKKKGTAGENIVKGTLKASVFVSGVLKSTMQHFYEAGNL